MKVNVAQIRRQEGGSAHFDLKEDFATFESTFDDVSFTAPVHVQLQVNNAGKSLQVNGSIQTELKTHCGRCLEEFVLAIDQHFDDEWVSSAQATSEQKENALVFEKDDIELDERIQEQIILAMPMKAVCSEECKGLCPVCGINLNQKACDCNPVIVDPRLAALAQWSRKD